MAADDGTDCAQVAPKDPEGVQSGVCDQSEPKTAFLLKSHPKALNPPSFYTASALSRRSGTTSS